MVAAQKMAGKIVRNGPIAVRFAIEAALSGRSLPTEEAMLYERNLFGLVSSTADMREGLQAFPGQARRRVQERVSWSELNDRRTAVRRRFPNDLVVAGDPPVHGLCRCDASAAGNKVVDVGASKGAFGAKLAAGAWSTLPSTSIPLSGADFADLEGFADASVDVVTCFEMIEHVSAGGGGGGDRGRRAPPEARRPKLFVSTPNVHHPWSFRSSATHVTPFPYDELGGLIEGCGFTVKRHVPLSQGCCLERCSALSAARPLYRILGIDYAKSLLVVAEREQRSEK